MFKLGVSFLILMNPFAQFLYLKSVADELDVPTFTRVYGKASLMSFIIYIIFAKAGDALFTEFFSIRFESFKIFGGIIIFSYAFLFILTGAKSMVRLKENLDDLASEIALPFIVGAGTIYLSILIGKNTPNIAVATVIIGAVMLINFLTVVLFALIKEQFKKKRRIAFDKLVSIAMRLNGFFMGAIGVHMVMDGLVSFFK
jgi:multiple antibiotic resistance protein